MFLASIERYALDLHGERIRLFLAILLTEIWANLAFSALENVPAHFMGYRPPHTMYNTSFERYVQYLSNCISYTQIGAELTKIGSD